MTDSLEEHKIGQKIAVFTNGIDDYKCAKIQVYKSQIEGYIAITL